MGVTSEGVSLDREQVLDAISALVELHLVEPSSGDPELPRFTLLEAPRAYAIELLEMSGELDDVRARMYEWCLGFAERAGRGLVSAQERRWLDLVEAELPTIRTTLAALAKRSDAVRGVALVTAVAELWIQRGPIREAMTWLRTFLDIDHANRRLSEVDREMAVCWMQRLRQESGEPPQLDELRRARSTVVNAGCSPAQFHRSTDHLVSALLLGRDPAECRDLIDAGTSRARESDDSYWLSIYLFRRAYLHWTQARGGMVQRAVPYVEEALEVARANGHRRVAARSASLLGLCRVADRDWSGALRAMTAAVADLREIGDRPATVSALQCLGTIHIELGDPVSAGSWLRDAIVETRRIGYGLGELYCTWGVAFLAARAGRSDDAVRMDDALNDHLAAVQPGMPEVLVADYTAAMIRSRTAAGAGPRVSGGHGWGWLRNRALEVAAEIAESAMTVGSVSVAGAGPAADAIPTVSALGVDRRPDDPAHPDERLWTAPGTDGQGAGDPGRHCQRPDQRADRQGLVPQREDRHAPFHQHLSQVGGGWPGRGGGAGLSDGAAAFPPRIRSGSPQNDPGSALAGRHRFRRASSRQKPCSVVPRPSFLSPTHPSFLSTRHVDESPCPPQTNPVPPGRTG